MDLKKPIKAELDEAFLQLMPDDTFATWTTGRFAPVDRFLSNFHKPLQRRMLFTDADVELPAIRVIKDPISDTIFLLGQSRIDVQDGKRLQRLSVCHDVSTENSGKVSYYNYDPIDPATALEGETGKVLVGDYFISVEYVSTKSAEFGDEAFQGKLLAYAQLDTPFKRDGTFSIGDKSYKVIQSYIDSGFSCAVVLEQEDDIQQVTIDLIDETTSRYDPVSGDKIHNFKPCRFPATVDQQRMNDSGRTLYNVYVKLEGNTSSIKANSVATLQNGKKIRIKAVNEDLNTQGQCQLICEA